MVSVSRAKESLPHQGPGIPSEDAPSSSSSAVFELSEVTMIAIGTASNG